jgi:hypothetical protein
VFIEAGGRTEAPPILSRERDRDTPALIHYPEENAA